MVTDLSGCHEDVDWARAGSNISMKLSVHAPSKPQAWDRAVRLEAGHDDRDGPVIGHFFCQIPTSAGRPQPYCFSVASGKTTPWVDHMQQTLRAGVSHCS